MSNYDPVVNSYQSLRAGGMPANEALQLVYLALSSLRAGTVNTAPPAIVPDGPAVDASYWLERQMEAAGARPAEPNEVYVLRALNEDLQQRVLKLRGENDELREEDDLLARQVEELLGSNHALMDRITKSLRRMMGPPWMRCGGRVRTLLSSASWCRGRSIGR